ncbi:DUF2851 family protein [Marinigracilibium pacificum]|uniref:DUF2851 family protein n=1 Tax=Marinigracilibium pacificum TaxID=2729599 RepID=A0A848IZQ8_9BACT|nr:DUF2851 family protein [Marinigracilibium pacificum]NMM49096.1 DUF2851 family protein [Marinigracilibium pacificum]
MQEDLIHYLWKYQSFDKTELKTTANNPLKVFKTGNHNYNDGPDFSEGLIEIEGIKWFGNIEIHINASEWYNHNHHKDPLYDNVILHVVWNNDMDVYNADGQIIPCLELKELTSPLLVRKYKQFLQPPGAIPCAVFESSKLFDSIRIRQAFDLAMTVRMDEKCLGILNDLKYFQNDWNKIAYKLLLKAFGFKINQEAFEQMAFLLDEVIIQKNRHNLQTVEAYLFGIGGFLNGEPMDLYHENLTNEFKYLKHKYNIREIVDPGYWRFMRLRPVNFPTVRIAQFAAIICNVSNLFNELTEDPTFNSIKRLLSIQPSDYWLDHYRFGQVSNSRKKAPGKTTIDLIIMNVIVPLLFTYSKYIGDDSIKAKALDILESLKPENNRITRSFKEIGFPIMNAYDSQASIGLYKNYCQNKKCLSCPIGVSILKHDAANEIEIS